jgi:hypothetical protein
MSVFESQAAAGRPIILRKPLLVLAGLAVLKRHHLEQL